LGFKRLPDTGIRLSNKSTGDYCQSKKLRGRSVGFAEGRQSGAMPVSGAEEFIGDRRLNSFAQALSNRFSAARKD
jgi:hypothetical protein